MNRKLVALASALLPLLAAITPASAASMTAAQKSNAQVKWAAYQGLYWYIKNAPKSKTLNLGVTGVTITYSSTTTAKGTNICVTAEQLDPVKGAQAAWVISWTQGGPSQYASILKPGVTTCAAAASALKPLSPTATKDHFGVKSLYAAYQASVGNIALVPALAYQPYYHYQIAGADVLYTRARPSDLANAKATVLGLGAFTVWALGGGMLSPSSARASGPATLVARDSAQDFLISLPKGYTVTWNKTKGSWCASGSSGRSGSWKFDRWRSGFDFDKNVVPGTC